MTYRRCSLFLAVTAGLIALSPPLVSASPPGCDWNTDEGVQACMGGGPFDAGKNGNGDTYGPTGEAGFLQDTRLVLQTARAMTDAQLLGLGHFICDKRRQGLSQAAVEQALVAAFAQKDLDTSEAGYMAIDAEMYLCPSV